MCRIWRQQILNRDATVNFTMSHFNCLNNSLRKIWNFDIVGQKRGISLRYLRMNMMSWCFVTFCTGISYFWKKKTWTVFSFTNSIRFSTIILSIEITALSILPETCINLLVLNCTLSIHYIFRFNEKFQADFANDLKYLKITRP